MKKHLFRNCLGSFTFFLFAVSGVFAQSDSKTAGGIATLYALDPLARTLCFGDGLEGGAFQQNEVRNRCSDIDFDTYTKDGLTSGIEGGRVAVIVDLGSAADLQKRYAYAETVGAGQGFASLRAADGKMFILKDRQARAEQELADSAMLFAAGRAGASSPVKLGHIYLVRITDRHDKSFERIVKLIVIAYAPNESVTIRWQMM